VYYILSLERSAKNRRIWWKPHRNGYTEDIAHAGLYKFDDALEIAMQDLGNDLPIEVSVVMAFETLRETLPKSEAPSTGSDSTLHR
jgi:hypothetical protein